ncbi:MAG: DNA recombination protein RmuC [Candidatus Rokuibacteriota bacterium]|nr:MAG: DNA recombination protein RmuC [Candidatus Rokubacteria bacterium]
MSDVRELALLLAGVAVGGALAWLIARLYYRARAHSERGALESRLLTAEAVPDELRKQVSAGKQEIAGLRAALDTEKIGRAQAEARLGDQQRLADTFKALSSDALRTNNEAFLQLAREALNAVISDARGDLDRREEAIGTLVKPLEDTLTRYEAALREIERGREQAYGGLRHELESLSRATGTLVTALRIPQVRGRWGEITLQRVVELAGMSAHCDFAQQATLDSEAGRHRPDMIVRLPAGRQIVVDAKVPLTAYLDSMDAASEAERRSALERHAAQIRTHMDQLAAKAYWADLEISPELVVMFIPGESFFAAAVDIDRSLIEDGMLKRVVLATPTTLIALLRAIAYGWRQEQIAANATAISDLGKQLYDRLRLLASHFEDVGDKIGKAVDAYNRVLASMESRILPAARRFKDLGAATGEEIPPLEPVDRVPRQIDAGDVPRQLDAEDIARGRVIL